MKFDVVPDLAKFTRVPLFATFLSSITLVIEELGLLGIP